MAVSTRGAASSAPAAERWDTAPTEAETRTQDASAAKTKTVAHPNSHRKKPHSAKKVLLRLNNRPHKGKMSRVYAATAA